MRIANTEALNPKRGVYAESRNTPDWVRREEEAVKYAASIADGDTMPFASFVWRTLRTLDDSATFTVYTADNGRADFVGREWRAWAECETANPLLDAVFSSLCSTYVFAAEYEPLFADMRVYVC